MTNYMRVLMYRKCNDCGLVAYDHAFEDYIIREETPNSYSAEVKLRCPNCEGNSIGALYCDEELTKPYEPPQYYECDEE